MNFEQAIRLLDDPISVEIDDVAQLRSFLQSQQAEIDRLTQRLAEYERVCDICIEGYQGVVGAKGFEGMRILCPQCKGTGHIPRWIMPDWFVHRMFKKEQYVAAQFTANEDMTFEWLAILVTEVGTFTKLPNGTWELRGAE